MSDLRKAAQAVIDRWDSPLWKNGTTAAAIADLRTALTREHAMHDLARLGQEIEQEPVAWDKPSASFNAWWDSDYHDPANPFAEGSAAYWAWAGWKSAQRQWVGLTDEEATKIWENTDDKDSWELIKRVEAKLKERNSD